MSSVRKLSLENTEKFPLLAALLTKGQQFAQEKSKPEVKSEQPGLDKTPKGDSSQEHSVAAAAETAAGAATFAVGQQVILSASKHKDKYNEKKCEIKALLSKKVKLIILEGSAKFEEKTVPMENIRAIPAAKGTPAASAAVKEQKGDEANNALANSLFGDK